MVRSSIRMRVADGGATGCPKRRSSSTGWRNVAALGAKGIRINCTAPGVTETPILDQLRIGVRTGVPGLVPTPLGRVAGPDEQAAVLVFLNSRAASYITGQVIWVDGGTIGRDGPRRRSVHATRRRELNMASMNDFRRVADDVRNWGRWGDADELGTLNFITAEKVAQAASLVKHGKVFPLGVDFGSSGPQGAFQFRQNPMHVMTDRRRRREHPGRVRPEVAAEPGGRRS